MDKNISINDVLRFQFIIKRLFYKKIFLQKRFYMRMKYYLCSGITYNINIVFNYVHLKQDWSSG